MAFLLTSLRRSWPWWVAGVFLLGYELLSVAFGWTLLSEMVWADTAAYPPFPYIAIGTIVVLSIHFWLDRARWILPVGFGLIAVAVGVYETRHNMEWNDILQPAMQAMALALAGILTAWVTRLFKKAGIDLDAAQQQQIQVAATKAVLAIEERAARAATTQAEAWSAGEKSTRAVKLVTESVPKADLAAVREAIDAALPAAGIGAAATAATVAAGKAQPPRP
jgi:hypothetical protein